MAYSVLLASLPDSEVAAFRGQKVRATPLASGSPMFPFAPIHDLSKISRAS